jgi:hypothetical protein
MTLEEKFVGYAATEPFVLNEKKTYLKPMEFEPIPLDNDEVEILVAACGM